jgi:hypothetical protein
MLGWRTVVDLVAILLFVLWAAFVVWLSTEGILELLPI